MLGTLRDGTVARDDMTSSTTSRWFGNRGIYHQGWTAVTNTRTPWKADQPPPFDEDVLGACTGPTTGRRRMIWRPRNPEKLAELQRLWLIEGGQVNVVPLDDRGFERINAAWPGDRS